jgi:hypothetical protein
VYIEALFNNYFASRGLETEPTAFDGGRTTAGSSRSTSPPVAGSVAPRGSRRRRRRPSTGGTAGEPYDPCYQEACDDITNLSTGALSELGDVAAHATVTWPGQAMFKDGSHVAQHSAKMR